jgi:hypothetical protein
MSVHVMVDNHAEVLRMVEWMAKIEVFGVYAEPIPNMEAWGVYWYAPDLEGYQRLVQYVASWNG